MRTPRNARRLAPKVFLCIILTTVFVSGCMTWQPNWPTTDVAAPAPDVRALLQEADTIAMAAFSKESLQAAMDAHYRVLDADPSNFRALTGLANQTILMGAAFTDNPQTKNAYYRAAMRHCERAMYTNPDFKAMVDQGKAPWEACQVLSIREVPAMIFWTTAVLYIFKEVLSFPEQVGNITWVERTGPFLVRMEAVAPEWGGGAIHFTQSLYFGILPGVLGGDAERSQQYLEQAVSFGAPWMLSRWGRAKYFHVRDQNRLGFEADLHWVLNQEVNAAGEAIYWRFYFKQDARDMLMNVDRYF